MWAKQSTAATLIVGPILDSAGAEYASAVIGDLSISKNGGTLTAMAAAATLTHIANGQYTLVTTTGNIDTLGRAQITCNKSTYQMPPVNLMVVPAMVFDSMVLGTDVMQVDVTQLLGTAWLTPATAGMPDVNVKTYATDAISAAAVSAAAANKIADHARRRTQANVEASSDGDAVSLGSLYGLIQQGQESAASGTTLTVYKTDGTTSLGTKTLSTNAAADPVDGIS